MSRASCEYGRVRVSKRSSASSDLTELNTVQSTGPRITISPNAR